MKKFKVGILGATGMVGQKYISLLANHPWFSVVYVAASSQSAGKSYAQAVKGRWQMNNPIPENIKNLTVYDVEDIENASKKCDFVFSAFEIADKKEVIRLEQAYANASMAVISNSSANRWATDVPMIIPEINSKHSEIIPIQQKNNGFGKGFIACKPNCSIQSYLTAIYALEKAGYPVKKILVTTLQAVSGAGYPGVPSLDMIDNIVPYIGGEEEKTENEPKKILGEIKKGVFVKNKNISISATCIRVPVSDGHTASISIKFENKKPSMEKIIETWEKFVSVPQKLNLPSAPIKPIHYFYEEDRPQPKKDRDIENGMGLALGRLRKCDIFDYKFIGLSHNTIRGAAGGAILMAELLVAQKYIK